MYAVVKLGDGVVYERVYVRGGGLMESGRCKIG